MKEKIFNFIYPSFLKKLDKYLLINYPIIWTSRIHINLYYSILINLFIIIFLSSYPLSLSNVYYFIFILKYNIYIFYSLITLLVILMIIIVRQIKFNVSKYYPNLEFNFLKILSITTLSFIIFFSPVYIFNVIFTKKMNNVVFEQKLKNDIYELNSIIPYITNSYSLEVFYKFDENSKKLYGNIFGYGEAFNLDNPIIYGMGIFNFKLTRKLNYSPLSKYINDYNISNKELFFGYIKYNIYGLDSYEKIVDILRHKKALSEKTLIKEEVISTIKTILIKYLPENKKKDLYSLIKKIEKQDNITENDTDFFYYAQLNIESMLYYTLDKSYFNFFHYLLLFIIFVLVVFKHIFQLINNFLFKIVWIVLILIIISLPFIIIYNLKYQTSYLIVYPIYIIIIYGFIYKISKKIYSLPKNK